MNRPAAVAWSISKSSPPPSIWLDRVSNDRPGSSILVASLARTHHRVPRNRRGIRLENVALDHFLAGARIKRLLAAVDASRTSQGPHECRSWGGGIRHAKPAISGNAPGKPTPLEIRATTSHEVIGSPSAGGATRSRMPSARTPTGWNRPPWRAAAPNLIGNVAISEVRTHQGCPKRCAAKPRTTGLRKGVAGINHPNALCVSKLSGKADVTIAYPDVGIPTVTEGVYTPQQDSQLLVDVMEKTGLARGHRVADLCTGSGVVAIAAGEQGAAEVTAFDICPRAVRYARVSASAAGVNVAVHLGSWARSAEFGPYDLIVCNPPYVPHNSGDVGELVDLGPVAAWDAGYDGRRVLDPLCAAARDLLADSGTMLLVQSEFAGPRQTLAALAASGLDAEIIAWQWIPFGLVLTAHAQWLEETGRLEPGRREEELVVIRADKP